MSKHLIAQALMCIALSASSAFGATLSVPLFDTFGTARTSAASSLSPGVLDSTVGTTRTRASVSLTDGSVSVDADISTGTIRFETSATAGSGQTFGTGGSASLAYAFDFQNTGIPLPAGLFQLTIDGTFSGGIPDNLELRSAFGALGVELQVPGVDAEINIAGSADPFGGPPNVSGRPVMGFVDFNASGGAFSATFLSGTTILGDPQVLPTIRLVAGANINFSTTTTNGGSFAISSLNTAYFRIDPTLGVAVSGVPSALLLGQTPVAVPVPAGLPLMLSGGVLLWLCRRHRRAARV